MQRQKIGCEKGASSRWERGHGLMPASLPPLPAPRKVHLPVNHKDNTQLTADRRGQSVRSWLCSEGEADLAHHHRDSQVI